MALKTKGGRPKRVFIEALSLKPHRLCIHQTVSQGHLDRKESLVVNDSFPLIPGLSDYSLTHVQTGRCLISGLNSMEDAMEAATIVNKWAGPALNFNRVRDFGRMKQAMVARALSIVVVGLGLAKVKNPVKAFLEKTYSRIDDSVDGIGKKKSD